MPRLRFALWAIGGCIFSLANSIALELQFVGQFSIPQNATIQNSRIGGLSGVTYDSSTDSFLLVSDTKAKSGSQVFVAEIDLDQKGIHSVKWTNWIDLKNPDQTPLSSLDAEGIAVAPKSQLYVSFEGNSHIPPGIMCFNAKSGAQIASPLPLPSGFAPGKNFGLQPNHGFESLCLTGPSSRWLFAAPESPLLQDAEAGKDSYRGLIRILRYDLKLRNPTRPDQRAYLPERDAIYTSVTDLVALDHRRLLVLERQLLSTISPRTRRIRIYEVDWNQRDATDISSIASLRNTQLIPLRKTLRFDSDSSPLSKLDNMEGMCLGPSLGKDRSLVLVSDDNFSKSQQTQFLLLKLIE